MIGEINPMSKEDDYKHNAAETIDLANRAATSADKGHLLDLRKSGSISPIAPTPSGSEGTAAMARCANTRCCAASSALTGARPNKLQSSSTIPR
jgi:hypothetical protein